MILPVAKVSDLIILPWAVTQDDWDALKKTYVILDRIRTDDKSINPTIVISNNRITATDLNHPYVKNRFSVAEQMKIRAAETLIWKRTPYTNMLLKNGSIPQMDSRNDSILKAKAEHKMFTAEMLAMLAEEQGKGSLRWPITISMICSLAYKPKLAPNPFAQLQSKHPRL